MKKILILLAFVLPWCCPLAAQNSHLHGDCYPVGMATAVTAATDGLTAGIGQAQVLRRPGFPEEIIADDSPYTLPTALDARYAAFAFDSVVAVHEGYYLYRYHAVNAPDRILTDSVNVRLTDEPDTVGEPVSMPVPQIVNLVVIDHHGFHCFKVLNASDFARIALKLYDRRGLLVYGSDDYRNDYDMSALPADTYYYRLTASTPDGEIDRKGFVELVKTNK